MGIGIAHLRRSWRDARAAAMIEFAVLAPVLITVLFGLGDFAVTIFAKMLTGNAAQGLADLATQSSRLQTSDLGNVYSAATAMMQPLSASNLVMRITNIATDGNGNAFVYWSCGQGNMQPFDAKSPVTTTATGSPVSNYLWMNGITQNGAYTINGTNTSFIQVEATNSIMPPTQFVLKTSQTTNVVAFTLPRLSTYIGFPWDGVPTHFPPAPTATTSTGTTTVTTSGSTVTCNYSF